MTGNLEKLCSANFGTVFCFKFSSTSVQRKPLHSWNDSRSMPRDFSLKVSSNFLSLHTIHTRLARNFRIHIRLFSQATFVTVPKVLLLAGCIDQLSLARRIRPSARFQRKQFDIFCVAEAWEVIRKYHGMPRFRVKKRTGWSGFQSLNKKRNKGIFAKGCSYAHKRLERSVWRNSIR